MRLRMSRNTVSAEKFLPFSFTDHGFVIELFQTDMGSAEAGSGQTDIIRQKLKQDPAENYRAFKVQQPLKSPALLISNRY